MTEKLTLQWCFKYPKGKVKFIVGGKECIESVTDYVAKDLFRYGYVGNSKLLLRPLSSLTEEEKKELRILVNLYEYGDVEYLLEGGYLALTLKNCSDVSNYLYGLNIDFETPSLQERGIAEYE